jgi:hypothetical protein
VSDLSKKTRLEEQFTTILEQVDIYGRGSETAEAKKGYETILHRLGQSALKLKQQTDQASITRHKNLCGELVDSLSIQELQAMDTSRSALDKFKVHWDENDYKSTQGDELNTLAETFKGFTKMLGDTNLNLWISWHSNLSDRFAIEDHLLAAQRGIGVVEDRRESFKKDREKFRELVALIPDEISVIEDILKLTTRLTDLRDNMDHHLPTSVKIFFESLDRPPHIAKIELFTTEVVNYLKNNGALEDFVITRKRKFL